MKGWPETLASAAGIFGPTPRCPRISSNPADIAAAACRGFSSIRQHQHVIVEHVKDGRQHFHVMMNRVDEDTGKAVDPGLYKKKARECSREMEVELGLKRLEPKKGEYKRSIRKISPGYRTRPMPLPRLYFAPPLSFFMPYIAARLRQEGKKEEHRSPMPRKIRRRHKDNGKPQAHIKSREEELAETLAWAWENKRLDILAGFGIYLPEDYFEP